jgi:hypothetical protein
MSEKISSKKKPVRRYKRAGLHMPSHTIRKEIKGRLRGRRIQKEVEIVGAALLEFMVERLLVNAADKVTKGNFIDAQHLHSVLNDPDGEIVNVFPKHIAGINL